MFRSTDPSNTTSFVLNTDDFLLKYHDRARAEQVIKVLTDAGYILKTDWDATKYCGMTIDHDVAAQKLTLSIPGYIQKMLDTHDLNRVPLQRSPGKSAPHVYGPQQQHAKRDTSRRLDPARLKALERIGGAILWAAIAVRNDVHSEISIILSDKNKSENTWRALMHLVGYLRQHPERGIAYYASDMILVAHSDANFASKQSRSGGYYFLGRRDDPSFINGAIMTMSGLQTLATACVAESEYIALFTNAKNCLALRHILTVLGYPQQTTPIYCDNLCAVGIANDDIKIKRMKYVDIKYHWVRDRVRSKCISVHHIASRLNVSDYFTKTHPISKHLEGMDIITCSM
jgi:hypothetical protein